jgi:hypothetical protein
MSVDFSVRIQLPPSLPLGEPQLCSIFGNLLENALDACRECTDSAPFIRICAQEDAGHIVIAVDNTCCHPPIEENGRFRSTKHDGFGMVALSIILFSGGMDTKFTEIRPILTPGIVLSTVGVLLTALFTGLFIWWISGMRTGSFMHR